MGERVQLPDNNYEPPKTAVSAAIQMPMWPLDRWAEGVLRAHRKDGRRPADG